MTRIHEWKSFENSARDMFAKNPENTRYSFKHFVNTVDKDGVVKRKVAVVIKVTDNVKVISYETNERMVMKRLARLTKWFAVKMATTEEDQLKDEVALRAKLIP